MIFEFVSERLIPRGGGYLSSTSCHYDHNITVLIKRSDTCCGYLSDGRAHVYFFSRLSIRPNLSPSSISSRGNFTLELPRIAHWFRFFFFGGEEERDKLNSAARRCRARSSAFSAAVLRVPLCIFPRGKKSERGERGKGRAADREREKKEKKREGREEKNGQKIDASCARSLTFLPSLPPSLFRRDEEAIRPIDRP